MTTRKVVEDDLRQGQDEEIAYTITTTPWASSPTSGTCAIYDITDAYEDVTDTCLSGATSIVGDVVTTPLVQALTAGHRYRVEVQFVAGGNTWEPYFEVLGER